MNMLFRTLFASLVLLIGIVAISPSARAATTTVCGLGCDFTTLNDAVNAPHVTPDTIVVQTGYTFTFPPESNFFNLPDDLTITCDSGVVIGDVLQTNIFFSLGNRNTFRGCTFEAVGFDASNRTDVSWLNNIFHANGLADITLTNTDGFTISGNNGLQHIQIQNADNGVISDNALDCYTGSSCLGLETSGGGPFNYADPADVPNDIVINNNIITNQYTATNGDLVHFGAGIHIDYTSNTLQSVPTNDTYITMLTTENASVNFRGNYFFFPEKPPAANSQTWAINLRISQADLDLNIENNSFIRPTNTGSNDGISCLGIYDSGMTPGLKTVNLTFTHNLCSDANVSSSNSGLTFGYAVTSTLVNLTEAYNGFYHVDDANLVTDQNGPHNSHDATDIIRNPVLRTENADPSDDYHPAPMSWYFDINGTEDIGAFEGARVSTYTVDQGCVVNYVSCMSQFASVLTDVLKDNDVVTVGDGTYPSLSITGPLVGAEIHGAGVTTTIFDAQAAGSALSLSNITNLTLSDLSFINSTATVTNSYTITKPILSFGGNDYKDSNAFGAPPNAVFFVPDAFCNAEVIQNDGDPITADGVSNINAVLLNAGPFYITVFVPSNVANDISDVTDPGFCGGGLPATHFVNNVFIANGDGTYTYNVGAIVPQSISIAAGMTTPPVITLNSIDNKAAGLRLEDVTTSTFSHVRFDTNDNGLIFLGNSAGNLVDAGDFAANVGTDITSESSGTNDLLDTSFDRAGSDINGIGNVRVRYNSMIRVSDSLLAPIPGVAVNFVSANNLTNASSTTNGSGLTTIVDSIAYIMTSSSLALTNGGYNPFTITAFGNGTYPTTSTQTTLDGVSIFDIIMTSPVIVPPTSGGGGGGLPSVNGNGTYSAFNNSQSTGMVADTRTHQLVKLKDDGNAKTQEDSTVYYIGADGKRHAFPNPSVYNSWYCDFSQVKVISASELANYRLGRNVTYRPGLRLVKFPTNPKVYVVQSGHLLRAIKDEVVAIALFGTDWAKQVSDIQDTFYNDYAFGEDVIATTDKAFLDLSPSYPSAEMGIAGYQDIVIPGSSTTCSNRPVSPLAPTAMNSSVWPFAHIPKTYSFNTDLNSTSAPSTDIRYLQEFLASKGPTIYADGRITGTYGNLTTQAVKNYQKSKNISQTGTVGPTTRTAINTELINLLK